MMKKICSIFFLGMLLMAGDLYATTITKVSDAVSGAGMAGMEISVTGTINETVSWGAIGSTYGVVGTKGRWSLVLATDVKYAPFNSLNNTYLSTWLLTADTNVTLDRLTINGIGSNILFDIIFDLTPNYYTPGSFHGAWTGNMTNDRFTTGKIASSGEEKYYKWNFSDPIQLISENSYSDLYGVLTLDFTKDGENSGFTNLSTTFFLDTDYAVPEPTTILLFGLGLLGFSAVSRKKHMA